MIYIKKIIKKFKENNFLKVILWSVLAIILIYIVFIGSYIYVSPLAETWSGNKLIKKTVDLIPYPAAVVGGKYITTKTFLTNFEATKKFYESQDFSILGLRIDFSTEDGRKRLRLKEKEILGRLIEDTIIKTEAQKRGLVLTDEMINQEIDRKLKEYGSENYLKENLSKLYGWDINTFKNNIVVPDLYKEKLIEKIKTEDTSFIEKKELIEEAKKELAENKDFSEVAKKYSEGESANQGGSLGWFSYNQMLPEVSQNIHALEKGAVSKIIESSLGYHVVRVEDKKVENNEELVKISQIFVKTKSFSEWLLEKEKKYSIIIPFKNMVWNKSEGRVEFKNKEMIDFEKKLLEENTSNFSISF